MTKVSVLRPGIPGVEYGNAICYSGYRENQSPRSEDFPSYDEICEDLGILEQHWRYLRIYDSSYHAELVLRAIRDEGFDLRHTLRVVGLRPKLGQLDLMTGGDRLE